MNVDYLTQVKPLEVAGLADAEIADVLSPLTAIDLPVLEVRRLLRERQLWMKDPIDRARKHGSIGVAMQTKGFPAALYSSLVALEAALYDQSAETLSTASSYSIAGWVSGTLAALKAVSAVTEDDIDAFYAIGGGRPFADAVATDVATSRAANQTKVADEAANARVLDLQLQATEIWNASAATHLDDPITEPTKESVISVIRAAMDAWEAA